MSMHLSLPAHTLSKTSQNKGDIAAFARHFVTCELARTLPPKTMDTTLDIVLGLRALRDYYSDYLDQLGAASVDLANLPKYVSGPDWAALNSNKRQQLEVCIAAEARNINAGIMRAIDFLARQLILLTPDSHAMEELMNARIAQYPTYAAKPLRKAKRSAA